MKVDFLCYMSRRAVFFFALVVFVPQYSLAQSLTLRQALHYVRADNPSLEEAQGRVDQARAAVAQSRAAFWPRLDVGLEYLRGDAPSAYLFKTIDARRLPPEVDFNNPGRFNNFETYAQAQINLYAGGRDRAGLRQSQAQLDQARSAHAALENELSAAAVDTFLALLSTHEAVAIAEQSVAVLSREAAAAQVRFEGGSLLRSDLLSLEVRLSEARAALVGAEANAQRLQAALAVLLGQETRTSFVLIDEEFSSKTMTDFDRVLASALEARPELVQAAQGYAAALLQGDVVRGEFLPRLDVQARLYHDDPHLNYDDDQLNWTLGAHLSWNLFSGFATRARQAQAQGQARESRAALQRIRRQIELEVRHAWLAVEEARAQQILRETALEQAEQAFGQVRRQFSGGAVVVTRFLEAELSLERSRFLAAVARHDVQRALAQLARAQGVWGGASSDNFDFLPRDNHGHNP